MLLLPLFCNLDEKREGRVRENKQQAVVMMLLEREKEKVGRQQMASAPAHMSKLGMFYARSKERLMKHTRSCKMAG